VPCFFLQSLTGGYRWRFADVLASRSVLTQWRVLACFDPYWPDLKITMAGFEFATNVKFSS
jgi:hypothetical protein